MLLKSSFSETVNFGYTPIFNSPNLCKLAVRLILSILEVDPTS